MLTKFLVCNIRFKKCGTSSDIMSSMIVNMVSYKLLLFFFQFAYFSAHTII